MKRLRATLRPPRSIAGGLGEALALAGAAVLVPPDWGLRSRWRRSVGRLRFGSVEVEGLVECGSSLGALAAFPSWTSRRRQNTEAVQHGATT